MDKILVIDTNVVVKWFLTEKEPGAYKAVKLYDLLEREQIEIWAPTFLLIELTNILLKKKHLSKFVVEQIIKRLTATRINFADFESTDMVKLLEVAVAYSLTTYDALYCLLAKEKNCRLVTTDKDLLEVVDWSVSLKELVLSG